MGLDMYLTRETYTQNWDHYPPEKRWDITVKQGGRVHPGIDPSNICMVIEQVGYWRKANAIHEWFVKNCQEGRDECQKTYVSVEKLRELLNTINRVLEDPELAPELLPPASGFFFGSTDYDEGYWQDLKDTGAILEALDLDEPNQFGDYQYQSSW